jgi:hypothetical protein
VLVFDYQRREGVQMAIELAERISQALQEKGMAAAPARWTVFR